MTAAADWDTALLRLLAEDAELGHPAWCDRSVCSVEWEAGELTGAHQSALLAAVKTDDDTGANPADFYFSLEQWCANDTPVVQVAVMADHGSITVTLHPDQLAPLVDAITAARAVTR